MTLNWKLSCIFGVTLIGSIIQQGSCCSTLRRIECYQNLELNDTLWEDGDQSKIQNHMISSINRTTEQLEQMGPVQKYELVECPKGKDACLTIDWTLPVLKTCTKLGNLKMRGTLGVKKHDKTSVKLDQVCLTDLSRNLNRVLKGHLKQGDNFRLVDICACTWDGCNGGARNAGSLSLIGIVTWFVMKIMSLG